MADKPSGKIFLTVTHETTGETATIRHLSKPLRFRVQVHNETFEDRDAETVREWTVEALKRHAVQQWVPVIEVYLDESDIHTIQDSDDHGYARSASCSIQYRRFYLGISNASSRLQMLAWNRYEAKNVTAMASHVRELRLVIERSFGGVAPRETLGGFTGELPYIDRGHRKRLYGTPRDAQRDVTRAVLPYTDELWTAISNIDTTLMHARSHLMYLLERPNELAILATTQNILAPALPTQD